MARFGSGGTLVAAIQGARDSQDRFTAAQDRQRAIRRQDEQDAIAAEERTYQRGRREKDDAYQDWSREREQDNAAIADQAAELERAGLDAMQAAYAGDFSRADELASKILGAPVRSTALPDGRIELDIGGRKVVANSVDEWAMGDPRKRKRAGFMALFSKNALANYLQRSASADDQAAQYEREDARDARQYGRQVALQDRADARADARLRFGQPQQVTMGDGTVVERAPGDRGPFRPVMVDTGQRPPPPGLAAQGDAWQPGSEPRFGPQPPGGPQPMRLPAGQGLGGRGAGAVAANPFGNSADAQRAWMAVRSMAAADTSGALKAQLDADPYVLLHLHNQLQQGRADQATRAKMAAQFLLRAQQSVLPGQQVDAAALQADVQALLQAVDGLSGADVGGAGAMPGGAASGVGGGSPYPDGTRLQGPDGAIYVVRGGVPVPLGG